MPIFFSILNDTLASIFIYIRIKICVKLDELKGEILEKFAFFFKLDHNSIKIKLIPTRIKKIKTHINFT